MRCKMAVAKFEFLLQPLLLFIYICVCKIY
nr:MAG TPA: hypothetical protein [Caudoviricetes sp.]